MGRFYTGKRAAPVLHGAPVPRRLFRRPDRQITLQLFFDSGNP